MDSDRHKGEMANLWLQKFLWFLRETRRWSLREVKPGEEAAISKFKVVGFSTWREQLACILQLSYSASKDLAEVAWFWFTRNLDLQVWKKVSHNPRTKKDTSYKIIACILKNLKMIFSKIFKSSILKFPFFSVHSQHIKIT